MLLVRNGQTGRGNCHKNLRLCQSRASCLVTPGVPFLFIYWVSSRADCGYGAAPYPYAGRPVPVRPRRSAHGTGTTGAGPYGCGSLTIRSTRQGPVPVGTRTRRTRTKFCLRATDTGLVERMIASIACFISYRGMHVYTCKSQR